MPLKKSLQPSLFQHPIQRVPIVFDQRLGDETSALFSTQFRPLISGVAGCSSYLRGLIEKHHEWLSNQLDTPLKESFSAILQQVKSGDDAAADLRVAKQRTGLILALADCAGVASLEDVTNSLTVLSDFAVQKAVDAVAETVFGNTLEVQRDLVVFAMGKTGAGELNYSSDIDLIFFFNDKDFTKEQVFDVRAKYVALVKGVMKMLTELRSDGYVFRTDVRLRPNPSVTPVCSSLSSAREYYSKEGRTWERAAFIKARACAGNLELGKAFLEEQQSFVWRRQLNFSAMREIENIQDQIAVHKGLDKITSLSGYDVKLGAGGIRAIEFFVQMRQLAAGGRDENLRQRATVDALDALSKAGWVTRTDALKLIAAYRQHREVEHRIQMQQDAQRHTLPKSEEGWQSLAAFCGFETVEGFQTDLQQRFNLVSDIVRQKLGASQIGDDASPTEEQFNRLQEWQELPVLRSEVSKDIFAQLKPKFLTHLNKSADPAAMLSNLDLFFSKLSSGVELFSLFQARVDILFLVMDLCSLSPNFARALADQTQVLDGLAFDSFFTVLPDVVEYEEMLDHVLAGEEDYENQLIKTRYWQAEQLFRIKVQQLRGAVPVDRARNAYSDLAQAVVRKVIQSATRDFERRFGRIDGSSAVVLAMGKMGSREMTCASDLDLIVVFDGKEDSESDGRSSLDIRTYYARLTRHFITALSSPMSGGQLYEVDMRLRPSGRNGPVATSIDSFRTYQFNEAWLWEHLALSRARVVAGDVQLAEKLHLVQDEIVARQLSPEKLAKELQEMRNRIGKLASAKPEGWPIKQRLGGILDIELFAQGLSLLVGQVTRRPKDQIELAARAGLLSEVEAKSLIQTHGFLVDIEHQKRLLSVIRFNATQLSEGAKALFVRETGLADIESIQSELREKIASAKAIIDQRVSEMA